MSVTFSKSSLLSETLPATLARGASSEVMFVDCRMRYTVQEYISAHSLTTLESLINACEFYYQRDVFFGFGALLVYPSFDNMFDEELRSFFLSLCSRDHMGKSLMQYVFPYGLPYEFYETDIDEGFYNIFSSDEGVDPSLVREFVL